MSSQKTVVKSSSKESKRVRIYFMGKAYEVLEGLTIMKTLEYAGYRLIRGWVAEADSVEHVLQHIGFPGEYRLRIGLVCQTIVQDGMHLVILPYSPMEKP